jgi:LysR family transcriptional regulator, glycine cleavage system transcriptional activator
MMNIPSTRSLAMLEAIARLGTFRAAAAELNATPSAISHRIADLESNLGCLLFTRNGRSVQITSAGKEYAREIRIALGMMAQSQNRLLKGSCNVPIRIALIPPFAHYWLVPRLTSLEHSFPNYSFDFIFVNQPTEEVGNEVDFVIDYGADELFVERGFDLLLPRRATLVAAPEYHAEIKGKLQSSPLEGYRLLENANLPHELPLWLAKFNPAPVPDVALNSYRFSSSSLLLAAVRNGFGVGLACRNLVQNDFVENRLVAPFEETLKTGESFFFARMPRMLNDRLAKDIRNWFLAEATASNTASNNI